MPSRLHCLRFAPTFITLAPVEALYVAVYDIVPQSAIVAEVYGTTGEAQVEPSHRFGIRWGSEKLIIAATCSNASDGSGDAGFEIGLLQHRSRGARARRALG